MQIGEDPVRTGVTEIFSPGTNWRQEPVEGGNCAINGAGTTAGLSFIDEYHCIETPILLTNTLSVGTVFEGIVRYMVEHFFSDRASIPGFNPVVGETSEAGLNHIGGLHIRPEHAVEAIASASAGPVEEGSSDGSAESALRRESCRSRDTIQRSACWFRPTLEIHSQSTGFSLRILNRKGTRKPTARQS